MKASLNFILGLAFMFGFFAVLILFGMPEEYAIVNNFDMVFLSAELITIAGTCVIATGLPCATVLGIWGLLNVYTYIIVPVEIIKLLIFMPINMGLIYIIVKLARGVS